MAGIQIQPKWGTGKEKEGLGPGDGVHEIQAVVEGSEVMWKVGSWGTGSRQVEGLKECGRWEPEE